MNWLDAGNYLKIVAQGIFTSLDFAVASVLAESFLGIILFFSAVKMDGMQ